MGFIIAIPVEISLGENWLPCNGQVVASEDYPALQKALGYNNMNEIYIPDFRAQHTRYEDPTQVIQNDSIKTLSKHFIRVRQD